MKGSAFKLGNVATKSALKHKGEHPTGDISAHEGHTGRRIEKKIKESPTKMKSPMKDSMADKIAERRRANEAKSKLENKSDNPEQPVTGADRARWTKHDAAHADPNKNPHSGSRDEESAPTTMKSPTKKLDWGRLGKGIATGGLSEIF